MNVSVLPLLAGAVVLLTACAEQAPGMLPTQGSGTQNAAERQLEQEVRSLSEETRNIVVTNTIQGAAAGALAGCGLALVFGGDAEDCLKGGVAGGVVGGVAGNQVGQQAAAANQELARQDEIIANLQGVTSRLNTVTVSLRNVVNSQNAEIASLRRQVANQQVSESAYAARVRSINANRQNVIQGLEASEANVARSYQELVSLEQQSGTSLAPARNAAASTEQRLAAVRGSVALVPTE